MKYAQQHEEDYTWFVAEQAGNMVKDRKFRTIQNAVIVNTIKPLARNPGQRPTYKKYPFCVDTVEVGGLVELLYKNWFVNMLGTEEHCVY